MAYLAQHLPGGQPPGTPTLLAAFLDRAGGDPAGALDRALALRAADPSLSGAERARLGIAADRVRAVVSGQRRAGA